MPSTARIYYKFGVNEASSLVNHAVDPLVVTPGWLAMSTAPASGATSTTAPASFGAASVPLKASKSFDTGYYPVGSHSVLVAVKIAANAQLNIVGTGNTAGGAPAFTFPAGPELIHTTTGASLNVYGVTSTALGVVEKGWRIFGYIRNGSAMDFLIGSKSPLWFAKTASVADISGNTTRTLCLGGGRYNWSTDSSDDDFGGVMIWPTALTRTELAAEREILRDDMQSRGLVFE